MNNQKVCSFYISEFHLLTVVLPYINEKIIEQKEIAVILQKDINTNVKTYLKNVRNLNLNSEKLIEINWKKSNKENINNSLKGKDIIVIGNKEYIDEVNNRLEDIDEICEILNCYKVNEIERIDKILSEHDKILSTKGKKDVKKFSQNAQKRKTIRTQI